MEWSQKERAEAKRPETKRSRNGVNCAVKVGAIVSPIAVALIFALRNAPDAVQVAAGLMSVVAAFLLSMYATCRPQTRAASHHRVSRIPLDSQSHRHAA